MRLAPVALFVYNRPWHTQRTVESLQKNYLANESELFIFSDAPKNESVKENVKKVREYIKTIKGFKNITVIERKYNYGLANSIIKGATKVLDIYGSIIVIEDDLLSKKSFLKFMNSALEFYTDENKIFSITGYNFPPSLMKIPKNYKGDVYFSPRCSSWSWGTWSDRWVKVDWEIKDIDSFIKDKKQQKLYNYSGDDKSEMLIAQMKGKIDSWAIRWDYAHFKNNAYCVYPVSSFIDNIGFDGSGVHCSSSKAYRFGENFIGKNFDVKLLSKIKLDRRIMNEFRKIFRRDLLYYLKNMVKKLIFYEKWKKKY